jgi:hypothetical protein
MTFWINGPVALDIRAHPIAVTEDEYAEMAAHLFSDIPDVTVMTTKDDPSRGEWHGQSRRRVNAQKANRGKTPCWLLCLGQCRACPGFNLYGHAQVIFLSHLFSELIEEMLTALCSVAPPKIPSER